MFYTSNWNGFIYLYTCKKRQKRKGKKNRANFHFWFASNLYSYRRINGMVSKNINLIIKKIEYNGKKNNTISISGNDSH